MTYKAAQSNVGVPAETMRHIFPDASKFPAHIDCICFQVQAHLEGYPVWYVRDLPANGGDFEWTEDPAAAKLLGWFWQVRFLAFCRRDTNRPNYGCLPVYRYEEAGKYQRIYRGEEAPARLD